MDKTGDINQVSKKKLLKLLSSQKTLHLATLGTNSKPHASYSPYILYDSNFFIFISELARHTQNIIGCSEVSMMIIEDELEASQLFARCRLMLNGEVNKINRDDKIYSAVINAYESEFGSIVGLLRELSDFHLYQVLISDGRYVEGFGKAFDFTGEELQTLI